MAEDNFKIKETNMIIHITVVNIVITLSILIAI